MKLRQNTKGIMLMEVIIAMSIFVLAVSIAGSILMSVVKLERQNDIQTSVMEDARVIMQQIVSEIQAGAIDYEEYYSVKVMQSDSTAPILGANYGAYGSRFFDPGKILGVGTPQNPTDLGVECSYPEEPLLPDQECEIQYTLSVDTNVGMHPWNSVTEGADASAFADTAGGSGVVDWLFLIDQAGRNKTMLGRKLLSSGGGEEDNALAVLKMSGTDTDQNGFIDTFDCNSGYKCDSDADKPTLADLGTAYDPLTTKFVPISPFKADVQALSFVINPIEDPYKAYAEPAMRFHPTVNISLTVGLSEEAAEEYPGEFDPFTLQTTVSAGTVGRVDTYPPFADSVITDGIPVH